MNEPYDQCPIQNVRASWLLRRGAQFSGTMMLFLILFSQTIMVVLGLILMFTGVISSDAFSQQQFGMGNTAYLLLYLAVYVMAMGLPMLFSACIFKPTFTPLDYKQKVGGGLFCACVGMGLCVCAFSNFAAGIWASFFQQFGLKAPTMPSLMENTVLSVVLNVVIFAVLPALLEEFVFRGYVLGALRPYGTTFAVVTSALLFGLMHCNLTQFPFAVLLGLVFGYFTVKLNNIWVACVVHAINNAMAVLLNDLLPYYLSSERHQSLVIAGVFGVYVVVGLLAAAILFSKRHPLFFASREASQLPLAERIKLCYGAPTMLIAILLFVILTVVSALGG